MDLSLVDPPNGVSFKIENSSGKTATLKIFTTAGTPTGRHILTLKGTSGSIEQTTTLILNVNPAEFTVNTDADTLDKTPGDGRCEDASGRCSLRAAVMEANALGASAVINIPAGTYRLVLQSYEDEEGGDLDIKSNVTLKGAGADRTFLDGNSAYRVLAIYEGRTVRVEGVTIQNGKVDLGDGGGIYNAGTLTLANSTVSGNRASGGGGIYNGGSLTLTNSTVNENKADYDYGGGIYNNDSLTLTSSTVSGNVANSSGGGIFNDGSLTLINSTVSGNTANGSDYGDGGGGIYNGNSAITLNLSFSTITLNEAARAGGGIYIASGTVKLKGVILAGNASKSGPECSGSLTSRGYNLIGNSAGCSFTAQATDITGQDPLLGELTENGGPTKTHLPQANSPVLDKVPSGDCTDLKGNALATDGRGVERPQGDKCDIGAVERKPSE